MRELFIAGAHVTPFGKYHGRNLRSLAAEGVAGVLADAGATAGDVDAVFFANAAEGYLTGQECIRGQVALQDTGLLGKPIVNVENACASGSTAFHLACAAVASGSADVALAIGAEKLSNPDRARTFGVFTTGWDVEKRGGPDSSAGQSAFMNIYADMATAYMRRTGATAEDFARVSVKAHQFGALNPNAQFRDPVTVDQVLASRTISGPLTLLMCSPVGDGASGLIVASAAGLGRLSGDPVRVLSSVLRSARVGGDESAVVRAARAAYRHAGLTPADVDVVEIHDGAAPGELIVSEELGIAEAGNGPALLRSGATSLGGRIPINPSGGLLSRGHPIGATGCAQLAELTDQLRGRCGERQVPGANVALAENGGGFLGDGPAAAVVTLLGRASRS
ncbi:thiolase family protein [Actinoplanes sp. NPDC049118]|uniref:thiolase family protein n=1 Tax=Actinoplanes sp. NPDC049118 TaxID=3155769 RepID=UPI0034008E7A